MRGVASSSLGRLANHIDSIKQSYSLECQTYLDDSCFANSVYLRNFECGLSSKLAAAFDCGVFGADDVEAGVDVDWPAFAETGGVGLFDRRLLLAMPLPLLLVVDETLFGECDCDGGVRRDAFSFCALAMSGSRRPSSLTKCTLDK